MQFRGLPSAKQALILGSSPAQEFHKPDLPISKLASHVVAVAVPEFPLFFSTSPAATWKWASKYGYGGKHCIPPPASPENHLSHTLVLSSFSFAPQHCSPDLDLYLLLPQGFGSLTHIPFNVSVLDTVILF